jgi:hypothetical protein
MLAKPPQELPVGRKQMMFASVTAWYQIVREFNLRRPDVRIYSPKIQRTSLHLQPTLMQMTAASNSLKEWFSINVA